MKFKFDYKITKKRDLEKLSEMYNYDEMFLIKESNEVICLADLMYNYDSQKITIQLI